MMNKHAGKAKAMMAKCGYASGGTIGSAVPGLKRGGAAHKKGHHTNVNVIVAPGGGPRPPMPMMPPRPPIGAGPPGAGGPPPGGMAPPPGLPPGGPPPGLAGGLPPGVRPPGMKRGGGVMKRADGGAAEYDYDKLEWSDQDRANDAAQRAATRNETHKPARAALDRLRDAGEPARARGGRTGYPIDGGGAGAKGRLEKIKAYGG